MRKHGKHARRSRVARRFGAAAAAGGAVALAATFPGSPAHASALPDPRISTTPTGDGGFTEPEHGLPHPAAASAAVQVNPARYAIRSGDTLGAIAARFCGSAGKYPSLQAANGISDPNVILAGAILDASQRACDHRPAVQRLPVVTSSVVTSTAPVARGYHHRAASYSGPRAVSYSAGTFSFSGLEQLWVAAGGPAWAEYSAARVAECERGGRSDAYNPSGATGIWQILGSVLPGNLDDPMTNARNAVSKFEASGDTWGQWVCKP